MRCSVHEITEGFDRKSLKHSLMASYEVSRTLVKSPPEVWAELEKAERLAELLGDGAIEITKSDPEKSIEWSGSAGSGTIELHGSAWGTKVRMTADISEASASAADVPQANASQPTPLPEGAQPEPAQPEHAEPEPAQPELAEPEPELAAPLLEAELEPEPEAAEPMAEAETVAETATGGPKFWQRMKLKFGTKPESTVTEPDQSEPSEVIESEASEPVEIEAEPLVAPSIEIIESAVDEPTASESESASEPEPVPTPEPVPAPEPVDFEERLTAVLDHLGSAHKRPFTAA